MLLSCTGLKRLMLTCSALALQKADTSREHVEALRGRPLALMSLMRVTACAGSPRDACALSTWWYIPIAAPYLTFSTVVAVLMVVVMTAGSMLITIVVTMKDNTFGM